MKKTILSKFTEHGVLLSPDAVEYIISKKDPVEYVSSLLKQGKEYPLFLTLEYLKEIDRETQEHKPPAAPLVEGAESGAKSDAGKNAEGAAAPADNGYAGAAALHGGFGGYKPLAKEYSSEIVIKKDITDLTSEGEIKDFVHCFNSRFGNIKKILYRRPDMRGATTVELAKSPKNQGAELKVIGIVVSVDNQKMGGKTITLEDETGSMNAVIRRDSPLVNDTILKDEVIGIMGRRGKEEQRGPTLWVNNIVRPEFYMDKEDSHHASVPVSAAFLSDIHLGSNTFLEKQWGIFIKWINGKVRSESQKNFAGKIKYLVIPGDVVDGIGIYPGQEAELSIKDIYAQYEELARHISGIPDYIKIIMLPGNHDAVRLAEPQPRFADEITKLFDSNVMFVSNPSCFSLHGVEVLAYHGRSIDDFITAMSPKISYSNPIAVMKEMMKRRHLAPIYGGKTALAPEHVDHLVIEHIPDIFVTGHVHSTATTVEKGVTMINASTWQSQTSFQRMMGFNPDPAKVPVVELDTMRCLPINFNVGG